ncbi:MAG TPA: hypothetical protein VI168_11445 [Croceibacterium sp.]
MSMLAVLLLAAGAPAPVVDDAIVVIGRRLEKDWRGSLAKADGQLACRTTRSTGDPAIDAIGCEAMVACTRPIEPQLDALAAADLRKRERKRQMDALLQTTMPCLTAYHEDAGARLAASRARP